MDHFAEGAAMVDGQRDHLVVFFSSRLAPRRDFFDFIDDAQGLAQQKLFLRTAANELFYLDGIPGLTTSMADNAAFLRFTIQQIAPRRVSFVGHSSGGYAAIVLGHLVGVDDVHAVTPVTYLHPKLGDDPEVSELWEGVFDDAAGYVAKNGITPRLLSCKSVIADNPGKVRVLRQYVIGNSPVDLNHANHIADFAHVQTVVYPRGRHNTLAARLVRDGTLFDGITGNLDTLCNAALPAFDRSQFPTRPQGNFRAARR